MTSYLATKAPLSICVDAETWQNYKSGVLKKRCGKQLDHCVMAVGYNMNANTPYWIVRNSWVRFLALLQSNPCGMLCAFAATSEAVT